jgi:lysophospholipase L1-like esterase
MVSLASFHCRLAARQQNPFGERPVVIACLGDSVTHGVFEVTEATAGSAGRMELTYDAGAVYHARLKRLLDLFYPAAAVQVINAGISGDTAAGGAARLERDVLSFSPDLCIVCFGLNDATAGSQGLPGFRQALTDILDRLTDIPTILLTPCMMNMAVSGFITGENLRAAAERCRETQTAGVLSAYAETVRALAGSRGVALCDEYARYEAWAAGGVDTDRFLANGINHPLRDIHLLWAYDLFALLVG